MFYDAQEYQNFGNYIWEIVDLVIIIGFIVINRIGYVAVVSKHKIHLIRTYCHFLTVLCLYEIARTVLLGIFAFQEDPEYEYSITISQGVISKIVISK